MIPQGDPEWKPKGMWVGEAWETEFSWLGDPPCLSPLESWRELSEWLTHSPVRCEGLVIPIYQVSFPHTSPGHCWRKQVSVGHWLLWTHGKLASMAPLLTSELSLAPGQVGTLGHIFLCWSCWHGKTGNPVSVWGGGSHALSTQKYPLFEEVC